MTNNDLMFETIERATLYINKTLDLGQDKVTGPGITLDLSEDFLIVTEEN